MPLPHPSWRNTGWLNSNPWFETEILPDLRARWPGASRNAIAFSITGISQLNFPHASTSAIVRGMDLLESEAACWTKWT